MKINNNITFSAKTNIEANENILSAKEKKQLLKIGNKIGTNSDAISISIKKYGDNTVSYTHSTRFSSVESPVTTSFHSFLNKPHDLFDYILKKLENIKKIYKSVSK